ncbi:MAG: hypothetical protein KAV82_11590 [Phycisphaerae bacterium]|nr:hypothetical protein [Phycisphaerae bacterium]
MTLEQLTDQLTELYRSGRRYRVVEQAHRVLPSIPVAPRLAELTLQTLLELKLGGPARELLQLRSDLGQVADQHPKLKQAVDGTPNGRVQWAQCADVLRRNITALVKHRTHLQELVDSIPRILSGVHLYCTVSGYYYVSRRRPGRLREWLTGLTSEDNPANLRLPPRGQLGPTTIIGTRISHVLPRVYQDTHHLFLTYSHPLYILEPDPVLFAAWLHCTDLSAILDDQRVYVFVGDDGADRVAKLLEANPNLTPPQMFINQSGTEPGAKLTQQIQQVVEGLCSRRRDQLAHCLGEIKQRYQNRDAAYWSKRFKPPGRVLGVTSRFTTVLQYSMRDSLQALGELGYESHMLIETKGHHQLSELEICRKLLELDPVMFLSLDHLRYELPHLPKNLPLLTWIQDPMANLLCRRAGESIGPFDFVCGHYRKRCITEFGYPEDAFVSTGIPVSTQVFHDGEMGEASLAQYACDVSFVSNASEPIERFFQSARGNYPPACQPMLEMIYGRVQEILAQDEHPEMEPAAEELVRLAAEQTGMSLSPEDAMQLSTYFAYRLLDWGRRQQTLEWVATWARRTGRVFRIYGRGWEKHPTLADFAVGPIEHGDPLRCANRASRLALQLIPAGFRHQRALEILASGSLPLARYCSVDFARLPIETFVKERDAGKHPRGIATIFPRLERVVFRTPAEFEELAERYLTDESLRQEVLTELRQVVLCDYTYTGVMRKVIEPFRKRVVL